MAFEHNFGNIRAMGRKIVLPAAEIQRLVYDEIFCKDKIEAVIDLGSGTLFWSNWLAEYANQVLAVDVVYPDITESIGKKGNIIKIPALKKAEARTLPLTGRKIAWLCDVLHHLDADFSEEALEWFEKNCDYIVIKDINMWKKAGNFMNKLHDRIINGEKIRNVDPKELRNRLEASGFSLKYYDLPRLWYPHFLIIAERAR